MEIILYWLSYSYTFTVTGFVDVTFDLLEHSGGLGE